ncbi:MAG TPA: HEXXH motif-containing putative peptide modification protein [Nitrospira sp.]
MSLFDVPSLTRIQDEFRQSMKRLLLDLCRDLSGDYADLSERLDLPANFFQFIAHALDDHSYGNWKVVGWIEALNDLVYFIDLLRQVKQERDQRNFAEQLFAECELKLFENSYFDDLFPQGRAQVKGLAARLERLCMKLAREVTQESLWFDPRWAMEWHQRRGASTWVVAGTLEQHFERAEPPSTVAVGTEGVEVIVPASVVRNSRARISRVTFTVGARSIALGKDRHSPICTLHSNQLEWHWTRREPVEAINSHRGRVTVGSTLHYGKDRQPHDVIPTSPVQVKRIVQAWRTIERAWPEGHEVLNLLTTRVIPLKAKGVVSFSYRHRPGLSFVNCFERDNLDLIDDLIHENSHHHLNLLLRKHVMYHGDRNQQIFYSPWRRSLRPIRGILHATFTFTMGALLFEKLSSWAETKSGMKEWKEAGLTQYDLARARFRCFEEIESLRYSMQDLEYAGRHLKWVTGSGGRLVGQLEEEIAQAERRIQHHREAVMKSKFGPALRRHIKELERARQTYGPVRLRKA